MSKNTDSNISIRLFSSRRIYVSTEENEKVRVKKEKEKQLWPVRNTRYTIREDSGQRWQMRCEVEKDSCEVTGVIKTGT